MNDIFISYSRQDKQFVSRLVADLEREEWAVYYDLKLKPSQNYVDVLSKQAALAKYFLVVLSPDSLSSKGVQDEVKAALQREREGRTTVVPLLFKPCDPQRITGLIGPKYYADFTNDYDAGFKEMSSALDRPDSVPKEESERKAAPREKRMGLKGTGVSAAIITGIVALITAYWQFVYKPAHPDQTEMIQYAGRVMDADTKQVISGAKVSVETQGVPQIYYSDSEGVFYLKLPGSSGSARIRVEANGYKKLERNVSLSRTGIEEIPLEQIIKNNSPANQNSSVGSGSKKPANNSKQDQINRILRSEPSNRPN